MQTLTSSPRDAFIGHWRLISSTFRDADGTVIYPLGQDAQGRIMYDGHGQMSAQLMRPERERLSSRDATEVRLAKVKTAFDGYTAYYGSYAIDVDAQSVTHHVEGSLLPNWIGRHLVRYFEFSHNNKRLALTTPPMGKKVGIVGTLLWEKIG